MHNVARAGHRARDRIRVTYVTVDGFDLEPHQIGPRARGANERPHRVSGANQRADNTRSDETRRAGHEHTSDGHRVTGFWPGHSLISSSLVDDRIVSPGDGVATVATTKPKPHPKPIV